MRRIFVLTALILILTGTPVHGDGVSIMAGFQTVSFLSDVGDYWEIPAGPGIVLNIGLPSFMGVPFDFSIGQRKSETQNTNEDVQYRWMEIGPRFYFGREREKIRPEIVTGAGMYKLDIGDEDFNEAAGIYVGVGFEDRASENLAGRFQIKLVHWQSSTRTIEGTSLNFSIMYGYQF